MNAMINQKAKALYRALTSASPASAAPIAKRRRMKRFGQTLLVITAVALGLLPGSPAQAETNWLSVSGPGSTWWCTAEYKSPNHAIYARNCVIKTGFYAKPAMIVRNASGRTLTRNSDELPLYLINSTTDALIDAQFCGGVTIYSGTSKACVAQGDFKVRRIDQHCG